MSLRESQQFFYDLCARPDVIGQFKKNRARVLKKYFRSEKDRQYLLRPAFERYQTYRDHVAFGLLGGIADSFPVIRSLVSEKEWNSLLNDFYLKRHTRSPIARQVFREFAAYLGKYRGPLLKKLPYLKELAHYEDLELRIFYDIDKPIPLNLQNNVFDASRAEELLASIPIVNPHHSLNTYRWPVHQICKEFSSPKKIPTGRYSLLVYRHPETLHVKFIEANPLVAKLITLMTPGRLTLGKLLEKILETHKNPSETFVKEAVDAIRFLHEKGVVVGFKK